RLGFRVRLAEGRQREGVVVVDGVAEVRHAGCHRPFLVRVGVLDLRIDQRVTLGAGARASHGPEADLGLAERVDARGDLAATAGAELVGHARRPVPLRNLAGTIRFAGDARVRLPVEVEV